MINQPLPELLRPSSLDDVLGQDHLLAPGRALRTAVQTGRPHSMILWGPPGVGKTSIARLLANAFDCDFQALSAVFAGVKDIRDGVARAQKLRDEDQRQTILFIDEIHRFNKSQQDGLLPHVENGLLTFIGATTENPSFEVNSALLSRSQVYVLKALDMGSQKLLLQRALQTNYPGLKIESDAAVAFCDLADGDARRLLNSLEQAAEAALQQGRFKIDMELVKALAGSSTRQFDKGGDAFYDQISALHKSVRGSDPDAALYWFCRMLDGGTDPRYLARRIVRMAWEDIGLADPRAMQLCNDAAATFERLGSPEGELALAQAVIYLAVAAKSNAGYAAFNAAKKYVSQDQSKPVPMHLRNAPTSLMKKLGHGKGYRYAHSDTAGYVAGEQYLPEGMSRPNWYQPVDQGLEMKIRDKLDRLRQMDSHQPPQT